MSNKILDELVEAGRKIALEYLAEFTEELTEAQRKVIADQIARRSVAAILPILARRMMEPSEAMIRAGDLSEDDWTREIWTAMLRACFKEMGVSV